uniref:(northern house mosquito) hypothetical protein n=1 Tax=Culex pipiens TaxID=7175 RepID=A0A8D8CRP2_CULPI
MTKSRLQSDGTFFPNNLQSFPRINFSTKSVVTATEATSTIELTAKRYPSPRHIIKISRSSNFGPCVLHAKMAKVITGSIYILAAAAAPFGLLYFPCLPVKFPLA